MDLRGGGYVRTVNPMLGQLLSMCKDPNAKVFETNEELLQLCRQQVKSMSHDNILVNHLEA